ncbi:MAG: hypothetical protein NZ483_00610 [Verrucomicrobiae bacterium]|nr:hypothetical protein [Verrucomicrobiae bacterium]MDW8344568.1 hypothetical protein [Verrucomicrobiae bacterium]
MYRAASASEPVAVEELQLALETLRRQYQALQQEFQQREAQVRVLTEGLAIARTESELFQRRWMEMQMRLQALGVAAGGTEGSSQWQRQVVETLRLLYIAEAEKERYREQLQALVAAAEGGDLSSEVARARSLLEAAERPVRDEEPSEAATQGTLEAARVLDVNAQLRVVVLNVGEEQGARVGMPFVVERGNEVVAELRVVEVRRRVSGAVIETIPRTGLIKPGDTARVIPKS